MNERHPVRQAAPMNGTALAGYPAGADDRYAREQALVELLTRCFRLATWILAMLGALLFLFFSLWLVSFEFSVWPFELSPQPGAEPWFSGSPIEPGDGAADARP